MTENNEHETIYLLYLGARLRIRKSSAVIRHMYFHLLDLGMNDGTEFTAAEDVNGWAFGSKLANVSPGAIIECEASLKDEGGVTIHGSGTWVEHWKDDATRAELQAKHRAANERYRQMKARKKLANNDVLQEPIQTLKDAVSRMDWRERRAFVAYLIEELFK